MEVTARRVFSRNLRVFIEQSGLSQSEVAQKLGVSKGTLCDYCHERSYPRPDKLDQLCAILGVSQYDLTTDVSAKEGFVPNTELLALAKELLENPEARAVYIATKKLNAADLNAVRYIILHLAENR